MSLNSPQQMSWLTRYLLCLAILNGCGQQNASNRNTLGTSIKQGSNSRTALLGKSEDSAVEAGDTIEVEVFGEKELSGKFQVSDAGTIDFPLIGRLKVGGLQPPEVATQLHDRLSSGYLKNPYVRVSLADYLKKRKIFVWGQVAKAGTFNFISNMTVIEALTLAGGVTPLADTGSISLTRVEEGKQRKYNIPMRRGESANQQLRPGDVIFVPESVF